MQSNMQLEPTSQTKSLLEMTESEWEALCDGCGKCCYRKYIQGRGKRQKLYYTRIACNLLDPKQESAVIIQSVLTLKPIAPNSPKRIYLIFIGCLILVPIVCFMKEKRYPNGIRLFTALPFCKKCGYFD